MFCTGVQSYRWYHILVEKHVISITIVSLSKIVKY